MRIHKEGKGILTKLLLAIVVVDVIVGWLFYAQEPRLVGFICGLSLLVFLFFFEEQSLQFRSSHKIILNHIIHIIVLHFFFKNELRQLL